MWQENKRERAERRGFTLVELLVTMAIATALLGLGVLIVQAFEHDGADLGAEQLQGWLHIAKTRALRDGSPRGLRLLVDATDPNHPVARQAQYIAVPNDFTGGRISATPAAMPPQVVDFAFGATQDDLSGGLGLDRSLWPVQPGDYLQVNNSILYRITRVNSPTQVEIDRSASISSTSNYKIIRQPRPVAGEEILNLPAGVIVDLTSLAHIASSGEDPRTPYSSYFPITDPPPPFIDILFEPGGAVTSQSSLGKVVLWVRQFDDQIGGSDQTLVTVYTRTGLIASHEPRWEPVGMVNGQPVYDTHQNTKSNWASGL